jgi:hypothetical protein
MERRQQGCGGMDYDKDKVDEAVLALLFLTMWGDCHETRAWKGHDWETLDRLHDKGYIANPKGKAKSVALTDEGKAKAKELFYRLLGIAR